MAIFNLDIGSLEPRHDLFPHRAAVQGGIVVGTALRGMVMNLAGITAPNGPRCAAPAAAWSFGACAFAPLLAFMAANRLPGFRAAMNQRRRVRPCYLDASSHACAGLVGLNFVREQTANTRSRFPLYSGPRVTSARALCWHQWSPARRVVPYLPFERAQGRDRVCSGRRSLGTTQTRCEIEVIGQGKAGGTLREATC